MGHWLGTGWVSPAAGLPPAGDASQHSALGLTRGGDDAKKHGGLFVM